MHLYVEVIFWFAKNIFGIILLTQNTDCIALLKTPALCLKHVLSHSITVKSKPDREPQALPIRCQRRRMGVGHWFINKSR